MYPCRAEKPVGENKSNTGAQPKDGEALEPLSQSSPRPNRPLPSHSIRRPVNLLPWYTMGCASLFVYMILSLGPCEASGINPILWKYKLILKAVK